MRHRPLGEEADVNVGVLSHLSRPSNFVGYVPNYFSKGVEREQLKVLLWSAVISFLLIFALIKITIPNPYS